MFYDRLFFQCTPQVFYGEKRDADHDFSLKGLNIILPNNTMSNVIEGKGVSLIKYEDGPESLSIFTEFLSHDEISIPFGYHKENLHEEKAKSLLKGMTYAVISDGKFVGSLKINVDDYDKSGNLEIIIGKPSNGYGRESLSLLLEEIYRTGFINNFNSHIFDFNIKSIGLHEKLGYRLVGNRKESYFANGKLNGSLYYEQTYEQYNRKK
jgi:RimJ/RimL family protein N-acetyltransferase